MRTPRITSRQRANFRLIELEIYNYYETKRELEELKQDIIEETAKPELGVSVQTGPGNITMNKAVRLTSSKVIMEMERRINAIEYAMTRISLDPVPGKLKLIQMKYFEGKLTDYGISRELHISMETFWRWKKQFIQLAAERLGWYV